MDVALRQAHPEDALEEYDSVETVKAIGAVIQAEGHSIISLGGGKEFLSKILQESVDFVFNIAEGIGNYTSREAQVPSVLEMLDIPYSGSGPQCLSICLDKALTKKIVSSSGAHTPKWQVITNTKELSEISWDIFSFPVFIKPAWQTICLDTKLIRKPAKRFYLTKG